MAKRRSMVEAAEEQRGDAGEHVVTIENFGPIEQAKFAFVPGRITVAYGSNGAGKSESQAALNALVGMGTDDVTLRDGAERGRVFGLGAEVKFTAKRCQRTGDLDILVVEEGFSLGRFVRPGFKTAESNDRQRLKDLASVLGIEVDRAAVCRLVGGYETERAELEGLSEAERPAALATIESFERKVYNAIVSEKTLKAKDPAEYVACLKADCDRVALENEKVAAALNSEADGLEETLPKILDVETDAEVLSSELANAVNAKRELERRNESADDAEELATKAEAILKSGQGQTVEAAQAAVTAAAKEVEESEGLIQEMEEALGRERVRLEGLRRRHEDAKNAKAEADGRATQLEAARADLASKVIRPSSQEWEDAERAIKKAEDAVALGRQIRDAIEVRQKIEARRTEAADTLAEAESLREAAKSTVGLLVEPINAMRCGIEVNADMRLIYVDHPTRANCPVEELSPGEAWALVIRLLVKVVGGNDIPAIVSIPQEALEGLDPINLKMLIDEIAKTKLMVFVAKATATEAADGTLQRDGVISKLVETWKDLR